MFTCIIVLFNVNISTNPEIDIFLKNSKIHLTGTGMNQTCLSFICRIVFSGYCTVDGYCSGPNMRNRSKYIKNGMADISFFIFSWPFSFNKKTLSLSWNNDIKFGFFYRWILLLCFDILNDYIIFALLLGVALCHWAN